MNIKPFDEVGRRGFGEHEIEALTDTIKAIYSQFGANLESLLGTLADLLMDIPVRSDLLRDLADFLNGLL